MKVSLRRSAVIQQEINNRLRNSDLLASSAELTEFHDVQTEMACREDKFASELTLRKQLIGVLFSIREQVGQKNAESGIDRLLTNNAQIDRLMALNNQVLEANDMRPITELEARVEKLKTQSAESYRLYETVSASVVSDAMKQAATDENAQLKKQKQKNNDQVLELNIRTEIELSDEQCAILTSINIL